MKPLTEIAQEVEPVALKFAPIEPTLEMIKAGADVLQRLDDCEMDDEPYRARGQAMHVYMDMIAVAPHAAPQAVNEDLLAALQSLNHNGHLIEFSSDTPEDRAIKRNARAAIKKAERAKP